MKKYFAVIMIAAVLMLSVTCFAEEVYKPSKHNSGTIGTSTQYWRQGYFQTLANAKVQVSNKDWASATGTWTLSTTEQQSNILYMYSCGGTGSSVIGPSEAGRVYTVFNRCGYTVTFKKSGGTGVSIGNNTAVTVAYLTLSSATADYVPIASAAFNINY